MNQFIFSATFTTVVEFGFGSTSMRRKFVKRFMDSAFLHLSLFNVRVFLLLFTKYLHDGWFGSLIRYIFFFLLSIFFSILLFALILLIITCFYSIHKVVMKTVKIDWLWDKRNFQQIQFGVISHSLAKSNLDALQMTTDFRENIWNI